MSLAVRTLAVQGAWIKLSGWYRLDASEAYAEVLHRCAAGPVCLPDASWGSDWPHTMFPPHAMPTYASTWRPVKEALGEEAAEVLRIRVPFICKRGRPPEPWPKHRRADLARHRVRPLPPLAHGGAVLPVRRHHRLDAAR
jgi:hypothetical protein